MLPGESWGQHLFHMGSLQELRFLIFSIFENMVVKRNEVCRINLQPPKQF